MTKQEQIEFIKNLHIESSCGEYTPEKEELIKQMRDLMVGNLKGKLEVDVEYSGIDEETYEDTHFNQNLKKGDDINKCFIYEGYIITKITAKVGE